MIRFDLEQFVRELDAATQAHLEWTRRVLRCAVLRASPGDDVLSEDAHLRCRFGRWLVDHRAQFDLLDAERSDALEARHREMHRAIRLICQGVLDQRKGNPEELDTFEYTQRELVDHLAHFKTVAVAQSSQVDALTGLPLRHRMEQDFDLLSKHLRRRGSLQMVMLVDVDHFKSINDRFGHDGGDAVLQHLASTLKRSLRADDLVYRYGGEEFLLLMELPAAVGAEAQAAARVRDAIRGMQIELSVGTTIAITATIGVALTGPEENLTSVIRRADLAMYQGKSAGRDRFVVAPPAA